MGFPEQFVPSEIKNQRLQPLLPPPGKGANPDPPRGSMKKFLNKKVKTQSGLQGLPSRGNAKAQKNQENIGTIEPLEFYYKLCDIENNLLNLFNKLNNSEHINGVVNLSSHPLTNTEISVLSKGLGFCPIPGASDIGNIIHDLDAFKRRTRLPTVFLWLQSGFNRKVQTNQGYHLNINQSN